MATTRRPSAAAYDAAENRNETRRPSAAAQRAQTSAFLRDLGADEVVIETVSTHIEDDDVQGVISRLRTFAEENPRLVLGALSALIAGGAVVAGRAVVKKKKAKQRSAAASKAASSKPARARASSKRTSSKRTLIEPHPGDKRYIRRDAKGRIKESDDVGRSLAADQRRKSKTRSKSGSGDKGDR
jgi:hypothetical protein